MNSRRNSLCGAIVAAAAALALLAPAQFAAFVRAEIPKWAKAD